MLNSLVSWFIRSDHIPRAPFCKNGPCDVCIQVADVDEDINRTISNLQRLIDKRCDLRSEQNRVHDPLRRLPVEVSQYIFELLLPLRTQWGQILQRKGYAMPTYLASICRGWHDMAWSNPSLWSTISLAIGSTRLNAYQHIDFFRDWIQRSQTLPLTLRIFTGDRAVGREGELKTVIDVINQCANRWHSLSISMPLKLLRVFDQYSNLQCQYQHLKRLQIIPGERGRDYVDGIDRRLPLLNPTASLEEIALCGVPFQSLQISWNHISTASVTDCDLEDISHLLQHAPQLTRCEISSPSDTRNFTMPPITHRTLTTLSLSDGRGRLVTTTLIGSLTLPNLQTFSTSEMRLFSPSCLLALMHRSSCPLTRVELFGEFDGVDGLTVLPLPGVVDLFLDTTNDFPPIDELLFARYFSDLRRIILPLQKYYVLRRKRSIEEFLRRKHLWGNRRRLPKFIIEIEEHYDVHRVWNDVERDLNGMDVNLTESGIEILCSSEDG